MQLRYKGTTYMKALLDWGAVDSQIFRGTPDNTELRVAGVVLDSRNPYVKKEGIWKGRRLLVVKVQDIYGGGDIEIFVPPDRYAEVDKPQKNDIVYAIGRKYKHQLRVDNPYRWSDRDRPRKWRLKVIG